MRKVVTIRLAADRMVRRTALVNSRALVAVEPAKILYPVVRDGASSVEDTVYVRFRGGWSVSMTLSDFRDAFPEFDAARLGEEER